MAEIIKFPEQQRCCDDCGKPLRPDEGKTCRFEGCKVVGCDFCTEMSVLCIQHTTEVATRKTRG